MPSSAADAIRGAYSAKVAPQSQQFEAALALMRSSDEVIDSYLGTMDAEKTTTQDVSE